MRDFINACNVSALVERLAISVSPEIGPLDRAPAATESQVAEIVNGILADLEINGGHVTGPQQLVVTNKFVAIWRDSSSAS